MVIRGHPIARLILRRSTATYRAVLTRHFLHAVPTLCKSLTVVFVFWMTKTTKGANRAIWLQAYVDEHYGLDLASLQLGEIQDLAKKLQEFATLGVDPDDLVAADEITDADLTQAGYKRGT